LAYLRFTRDHRGYENTYLVETVRRRGREHNRVLYWFRSPPQIKVGRAAIDEDVIRALEGAYPEITFDWTRILEARPPEAEPPADDRRRARGRGPERDREPRREVRPAPPPPATKAAAQPRIEAPEFQNPSSTEPANAGEVVVPSEAAPLTSARQPEMPAVQEPEPQSAAVERPEPEPPALQEPPHALDLSAAARLLGSEGLLRLRARHAEVRARISTQVTDAARQEALRELAERLNPDAWVTDDDVKAGLEGFEQVLDEIRREVGPLRRRTRRGGRRNRRRHETPPGASSAAPDSSGGAELDAPLDSSETTGSEDDENGE